METGCLERDEVVGGSGGREGERVGVEAKRDCCYTVRLSAAVATKEVRVGGAGVTSSG